jgi:hypothetical protein
MPSVIKPKGSKKYVVFYHDENGRRRKKTLATDKAASQRIANELVNRVALRREGVVDARADARVAHAARSLTDHLDDYRAHLTAKGSTDKHVNLTVEYARRVVALVKGASVSQVVPPRRISAANREAFTQKTGRFVQAARLADLTGATFARAQTL